MKRVASVLNIEADCVDNAVGTHNGKLHRALIAGIGGDQFDTVAIDPPRMP
jgi:tRNA/tmRNA/rRNA uracil-C5-methylase (TrmA/RlmC/RlmD family)